MMKAMVAVVIVLGLAAAGTQEAPRRTHLVIVVDGLRPDYVTPEVMPRLTALGQRGIVFNAHHSVFPTVTRVNASSFVTGVYPEAHGLMGNTIYVSRANATGPLDTGKRENLEDVERAEGRLLTSPTLSELLRPAGKSLLVVSSGSSGATYLLNHTLATGGIIHYEFSRPSELAAEAARVLAPAPAAATPNDGRNQYAVDAYLKLALDKLHPDVTFMWLNDPDGTAHSNGIGSDLTRKSLTLVDSCIGRIEDTLRAKGLLERTNIIVTSDHGFSTHTGELKMDALVQPFARRMPDGSPDIVVAEGAIHFRAGADAARVAEVVAALQTRPVVGAIFTRPRTKGAAEGDRSWDAVVRRRAVEPFGTISRDPRVSELDLREECGGLRRHHDGERRRRARFVEPLRHPQHAHRRRSGLSRARAELRANRQRRHRADAASPAESGRTEDHDGAGHRGGAGYRPCTIVRARRAFE
jgi:hypothetical protein